MVDTDERKVCILSQDSFYKVLSSEEKEAAYSGDYNFDHPGNCEVVVYVHLSSS